jgi:hypothetical protein
MTDTQHFDTLEAVSDSVETGSAKSQTPGRGLLVAGAIVTGCALLFALSPIILFFLGNGVAPWLMIVTLPLGGLGSVIGLVLLIIGAVRTSKSRPMGDAGSAEAAVAAQVHRARVLVFIVGPALVLAWPIVSFVVNNMIFGPGTVASISNALWPLAQIALAVFGIVVTARAKPSSSVSVPIYIVAGLLLLITAAGSLVFLGGSI